MGKGELKINKMTTNSQLPEGWEIKKLLDVCVVERGSSPRPIKKYITNDENGVNWVKIGDTKGIDKYIYSTRQKITKEGAKKSRYVKEGDFILSNSMSFGRPYIMKTDGYIHDGWFVLRLHDFIDTEYFFQLLSSPYVNEQFHQLASGSVVKNISGDLVKKVVLPIPPINEQQCIVTILDKAFKAIDKAKKNAEKNLKNVKELFESYLQRVFENKGEGWEETSINNETDLLTGFAFKSKYYTNGEDDILLLRGDNIMQGNLRWKDAKRWKKSEYKQFKKYKLQENDIVIAMDRPWVKAGLKCAKLTVSDLPALLLQRVTRLRCKPTLHNTT